MHIMTTGERIKRRRTDLGLTQADLAELIGLTNKATICKVEKGDWEPSYKLLRKYAAALHTTPEDLMGYEEPSDTVKQITDVLKQLDEPHQIQVLSYAKYIYMEQTSGKE